VRIDSHIFIINEVWMYDKLQYWFHVESG
jgi:hypothetical protein